MTQMIDVPRLRSKETPRQIIREDFRLDLPINGGWGYSADDAVIIDSDDPIVSQSVPFNGVSIEYIFVEKRIYEELIIFRPRGHRFAGIQWNLQRQQLTFPNDKPHDHLIFEVMAFNEGDWNALKAEWEGPNGISSPGFDKEAHDAKRDGMICKCVSEFWFEISSFYGKRH